MSWTVRGGDGDVAVVVVMVVVVVVEVLVGSASICASLSLGVVACGGVVVVGDAEGLIVVDCGEMGLML